MKINSERDIPSQGGEFYVNEFDRITQTWHNLNGGEPWHSGERGFINPDTEGSYGTFLWDGDRFHLVFRETWFMAARCGAQTIDGRCNAFYVWTRDFDHFYDINGIELTTPITPLNRTPATVVDPGQLGGVSWVNFAVDASHRPIIIYLKFAETRINQGTTEGSLQAFVAAWDGTNWQQRQLSDWDLWYPSSVVNGAASGNPPSVLSVQGPITEADGLQHWYVRATAFANPAVTTGWLEFDPETFEVTPAPDFQPPPAPCNRATSFLPLQYPDWVDPQNGARFNAVIDRSNQSIEGLHGEASDYYYLSWDAMSVDPATDPPPVLLSLRRTLCAKQ